MKKRGWEAAAAGAALALGIAGSAQGAPVYAIATLGLSDADHTGNSGYRWSAAAALNESGQAIGYSRRFNASGEGIGTSPWFYNGSTVQSIGLTDAEHTGTLGQRYVILFDLAETGQVAGSARRYTGGGVENGQSAWLYDGSTTQNIGLTDAEHTGTSDHRYSSLQAMNATGQVIGSSSRYNASVFIGESVWFYNGSTTQNIGFTDAEHTGIIGLRWSQVTDLNDSGQVIGKSQRFDSNGQDNGTTAWLYAGSSAVKIGLTDAEHTGTNGFRASGPQDLNAAGHVIGQSSRYTAAGEFNGWSAWLYNGSTTLTIGLTDADHTGSDGYRYSALQRNGLNATGQVIGYSDRFTGSGEENGVSAWLYNGSTTLNLGLTDAEHTGSGGYRYSVPSRLNELGQVTGSSNRYTTSGAMNGQSAWLYNGSTTLNIGLTDAEHTGTDDHRSSGVSALNAAGQALGGSARYTTSGASNGGSVWLYNGSTTLNIGFTDAEHTGSGGYRYSVSGALNDLGQVTGSSNRYTTSGEENGVSAWLYNGSTTLNIGLTDAEHTGSGGYRYSVPGALNDAGQATGFSYRFSGSGPNGQDAWFYDPTTHTTFGLSLSERDDGYAYSYARYLGQDGLVLGEYKLFDGMVEEGSRLFYFTMADGPLDLGLLVEGGLDAAGWLSLATFIRANGSGQILGEGTLNAAFGSQMAFLLTAVPIPAAAWFLASAIGVMGFARRRVS